MNHLRSLIILGIVISFGAACQKPVATPNDVPVVRMVTVLGRVMYPLAESLQKVTAEHYPAKIEVIRNTAGLENSQLIEEGGAELAMIQSDFAYLAYNTGVGNPPKPHRKLRGVAVLYALPLHVVVSKSSGIRSLKDLRGKRVAIGTGGLRAEYTSTKTLEGIGLSFNDFVPSRMSDDEAVVHLREGKLDAVLARGNDPSPSIQLLMQVPGARLIPIARQEIEQARAYHPFLHATTIPRNVYGDHPDIETVGVDTLLVCRDDLPEELVYWITRTLFESLPELARSLNSLRQVDLEQIHASPIPLHPGAARFYRQRELFQ